MKKITILFLALGLSVGVMAQKSAPTNPTFTSGDIQEVNANFIFNGAKAPNVYYPSTFNTGGCASVSNPKQYLGTYTDQSTGQQYQYPVTGSNFFGFVGFAQKYTFATNKTILGVAAVINRTWVGDDVSLKASVYNAGFTSELKSKSFQASSIDTTGFALYQFTFPSSATASTFNAAITVPTYTESSTDIVLASTELNCTSGSDNYFLADLDTVAATPASWNLYTTTFSTFLVDLMVFPIIDGGVGLSATELDALSYVYPNPAKDEVMIASSIKMNKVEIFNMVGQKVYETNVNGNSTTVNVSDFTSGSYVAKIYSESGVATKKVVVK